MTLNSYREVAGNPQGLLWLRSVKNAVLDLLSTAKVTESCVNGTYLKVVYVMNREVSFLTLTLGSLETTTSNHSKCKFPFCIAFNLIIILNH